MALQVLVNDPDHRTPALVHSLVVKVEGVIVAIDANVDDALWTTLGNSKHLFELQRHVVMPGIDVLGVCLSLRQSIATRDGVQLALVAFEAEADDLQLVRGLQIELKVDLHKLGTHPAEVWARSDYVGARGDRLRQWLVMIQERVE